MVGQRFGGGGGGGVWPKVWVCVGQRDGESVRLEWFGAQLELYGPLTGAVHMHVQL